jgi:hypothetical protein
MFTTTEATPTIAPSKSLPESKSQTSEELEILSTLCLNWRQNRLNKFDPMPSYLEQYISNTIISGNYTDLDIMKAAKITPKKLAKIAGGQTNNSTDNENPEFLPFTITPQNINTKNHNKSSKSTFKTANDANNLTINTANGDSISIPVTVDDSILQNIIKLFLCCK